VGFDDGNIAYDSGWFKGTNSGGTLDGKPVLLYTCTLAWSKTRFIFYEEGNIALMLLNAPTSKSNYFRSNFKLNAASPASSAATQSESLKP
jgi:hypothetical protein